MVGLLSGPMVGLLSGPLRDAEHAMGTSNGAGGIGRRPHGPGGIGRRPHGPGGIGRRRTGRLYQRHQLERRRERYPPERYRP
jgi:hypothetical protein